MKEYPHLIKLRNKLAFVFTFIIFFIIFILQFIYSVFRLYISTSNQVSTLLHQKEMMDNAIMSGRGTGRMGGMGGMGPNNPMELRKRDFLGMPRTNMMLVKGDEIQSYIVDDITNVDMQNLINSPAKITYINYLVPKARVAKVKINQQDYLYTVGIGENRSGGYAFVVLDRLNLTIGDLIIENMYFLIILIVFSFIIYSLGVYFVGMNLNPVKKQIQEMDDFVHNASHELKTPLAVMSSGLQLAKLTKNYDKKIDESMEQLNYMHGLIQGLIELSEIDDVQEKQNISVNDELQKIIKNYEERIQMKNIKLTVNDNFKLSICANLSHFNILVSNIIENAIKYNKDGGSIVINIDKNTLTIKDSGIGISTENLDKVYKRFFKEDESRSSEGYGIGLSLVSKIINIYKWKITINSEKGKGTQVQIRF